MFKANFLKRQYCFRKLINISLMKMQKKKKNVVLDQFWFCLTALTFLTFIGSQL